MKLFTKTKKWLFTAAILLGVSSLGNAQINDTITFDSDNIQGYDDSLTNKSIGNYTWRLNQTISGDQNNDLKFGKSIRMRRYGAFYGHLTMVTDKPYGLGSISFYAGRSNFANDRTGNAPIVAAEYSTDGGTTWVNAGSANLANVDALTKYTFSNLNISGNVRIRLRVTGGDSAKRFNIDSLVFTGYSAPVATCFPTTNVQVVDNLDGTLNLSWAPATPAPAVGYSYAVVPAGTPLSLFPSNFSTSTVTSPLNNITTQTDAANTSLVIGTTYDVYVISVCELPAPFGTGTQLDTATVKQTITLAAPPCSDGILIDTLNGDFSARTLDVDIVTFAADYELILVDETTLVSSVITGNPATLTGLVLGNNYTLYARAICSVGDTSTVGDTLSFQFGVQCSAAITVDTVNTDLAARTLDVDIVTFAADYELILVDETTLVSSVITGNPATLTGLVLGNNYTLIARAICSAGDTSTVGDTLSFQFGVQCSAAITVDTVNTDLAARTLDVAVVTTVTDYELTLVDQTTLATTVITARPATLSGLVLGNNYTLIARAICSAGDTSTVGDTLHFQFGVQCSAAITVDTVNTDLVARTLDVAVVTTVTDYELTLVDQTTLATTVITSRPATLSGLVLGNNYTLIARAICSAGDTSTVGDTLSFQFGVQCSTTISVDTVNTDLAARTLDVAVVTTVTDYELTLVDQTTLATTVITSRPATLSGLVIGNNYTLIARAICSAGDTSTVGDTLSFQFGTVCAAVTGLDTLNTDLGFGAIDITYTTTAPEVLVIVHDNTANTTIDSAVYTNPPYIQGLTLGNNYTVSVYAICGAGDTSATAAIVTFDFGTAPTPCDAATALVLEDNEDGSIDVSWTAPATAPADGYIYAVVPNGTAPVAADYVATSAVSLVNLTATTTSPAITFVDGDDYDVYVIALCGATDSSAAITGTVTVTIDNTPTTCPDITNLVALDNADGTISITWDAVVPAPAEGYGYAVVPAGTTVAFADFVHATGTSVTNLTETTEATPATFVKGATYDVIVIAMCSLTPQSISNQVKTSVTVTNIGVNENAINLTVYPNPAIESVYVNALNVDVTNATIAILDITGKVLSTTNMVAELTEVNVANLASGVYFVKVQSGVNMNIVKVVKK